VQKRPVAQTRHTSGLKIIFPRHRRAQDAFGFVLFSLTKFCRNRLLAPPAHVEPGVIDIQTILFRTCLYAWRLSAIYRAPTIGMAEAVPGSNIIVGAAGMGSCCAGAPCLSDANLQVKVSANSELEAVPYLYHVADLQFPFDSSRDPINPILNAASENAPIFDLRRLPGFIQQTFKNGQALVLVDGFDELDPVNQGHVVEWFKALLQAYPRIRIVTAGCAGQLTGLIGLGFNPLALIAWDAQRNSSFIRQWGELWSRTVALEAWAQTGPGQVDPPAQ
jgi:hypothetical protein